MQLCILSLGLALAVTLSACNRTQPIILGHSTERQLIDQRGAPVRTESFALNDKTKTFSFADGETYQSDNGIIRGHYRQAVGSEGDLDYWRSKWAEKPKIFQRHGSGISERLEILEAESGTSVIYNPFSARVERVMDYKRE